MDAFLGLAFPLSLLVLVVSATAVLVGVLGISRGWGAAATTPEARVPRGATIWLALGLAVGSIGTTVGALGLLFAALWCVLLLRAAVFEQRATAVGRGSPRWRVALSGGLWVQGASAVALCVMLLVAFGGSFTSTTTVNSGPSGMYTWLAAQYGLSLAAVGVSSIVAGARLTRLPRTGLEPDGGSEPPGRA